MASDKEGNEPIPPATAAATVLLTRVSEGDSAAAAELLPLVYEHLRAIAGGQFRGQRANHTLQPTALVHEAYIKLVGSGSSWKNRAHFCAVAATAMRQILSNHARAKRAAKRAGHVVDMSLTGIETPSGASAVDLVALDDALTRLTALNERYARMVELRFFGGLTVEEIAQIQGVSARTIKKNWRSVRAWLSRELSAGASG